jgi:hypothetical protein
MNSQVQNYNKLPNNPLVSKEINREINLFRSKKRREQAWKTRNLQETRPAYTLLIIVAKKNESATL